MDSFVKDTSRCTKGRGAQWNLEQRFPPFTWSWGKERQGGSTENSPGHCHCPFVHPWLILGNSWLSTCGAWKRRLKKLRQELKEGFHHISPEPRVSAIRSRCPQPRREDTLHKGPQEHISRRSPSCSKARNRGALAAGGGQGRLHLLACVDPMAWHL